MRTHLQTLAMVLGAIVISTSGAACSCGGATGNKQDGGGGGGTDGGQPGGVPTVTIESPTDGASFQAGQSIHFTGSATDPEDGALSGDALVWTSDVSGQIGLGADVQSALAELGAHTITLTATDSDGNSRSAKVTITITASDAPLVTITSPPDGQEASIGEPIDFTATVQASSGRSVAPSDIVWESDLDGQIGIGATIRTSLATEGTHTITCTATDDQGQKGSASITVNVVTNRAPVVTISAPADGAYFKDTDPITFRGSANDPEDGPIAGTSLRWLSDISGQIGIGNPVTTSLPLGDHVIRLNATDSQGAVGEAQITVHVVSNLPPVCTINRPQPGARFVEGQSVSFVGSCSDPESGAVTTGLVWSSDLDGQLGLGGTVQTALTTVGDHVVSLCAPDPVDASLQGCGTVSITVVANTPPTCTIDAPASGTVLSVGVATRFVSTVQDAEDPSLTGQRVSVVWTDESGATLAQQPNPQITFNANYAGAHTLTLTATDSGGLTCTASVDIVVNRNPSVTIDSVAQGTNITPPFDTANPIDLAGSATDPDGDAVTLDWLDNLEGPFGTGGTASLVTPLVGNHHVVLTGTDTWGGVGRASTTFTVLPVGQTQLVEVYTQLANMGRVISLGIDPLGYAYAGNNNAEVWGFDPATLTGAPIVMGTPDDVQAIVFDAASGMAYLGTKQGYIACAYDPQVGFDPNTCSGFQGGDLPSNDVTSIARVSTGNGAASVLVVGTRNGILIANDPNGSKRGQVVLNGKEILALAADGSLVWVGTKQDGLYLLDPVSRQIQGHWRQQDGAPSDRVQSVAVDGAGLVWTGTDNGLGRFDHGANAWTVWRKGDPPAPGLIDDNVQAVAVAPTTIGGVSRDVIWAGTRNGVSRFDPTIPAFMDLTTADGLPSNDVRSIAILSDGTKIFGTKSGVARYTGP
jgi:hypothetical protein